MTLAEQVKEVLEGIDQGPWHWADYDLILIYLDDLGYNGLPYSKLFTKDELMEELDRQAYRHKLIISSKETVNVWATRPGMKTTDILQEYIEIIFHN